MDLNNKTIIVTGGSSGIGLETAKLLRSKGANVVITGRDLAALNRAEKEYDLYGVQADVSNEEDVRKMVSNALEKYGDLHGLVNNAGFGTFSLLVDTTLEQMQSVYNTNVFGAMLAARECAKYFISKNYGNIINIASTAAKSGFSHGTVYSSSKFALTSLTECWRAELRRYNIRVMQINPSEVQTNFVANSGREPRDYNPTKLQSSEIAHVVAAMLEMDDRGFITDATVFATNPQ